MLLHDHTDTGFFSCKYDLVGFCFKRIRRNDKHDLNTSKQKSHLNIGTVVKLLIVFDLKFQFSYLVLLRTRILRDSTTCMGNILDPLTVRIKCK